MDNNKDIQKKILKQLDKYTETFLDKSYHTKQKNKKSKKDIDSGRQKVAREKYRHDTGVNEDHNTKNKRKKLKNRSCEISAERTTNITRSCEKKTKLEKFKEDLELFTLERRKDTVQGNDGCMHKRKNEPDVIVYEDPRKKRRKMTETKNENRLTVENAETSNTTEMNLKEARFEVRKFGLKGFHGKQKEEAMTSLLLNLGAKPPKPKCVNYKEYQVIRKQQIADERDKKALDRSLGFKVAKSGSKKKRRRKDDFGISDGQIGSFKNGVQYINTKNVHNRK